MTNNIFTQHSSKAVEPQDTFKHVMAITLNPQTGYKNGIIRCITNRKGNLLFKGTTSWSELHYLEGHNLKHFEIKEKLVIKNESEIISRLTPPGFECIGLEDPDIWVDNNTNLLHLYFTIPIKPIDDSPRMMKTHLGHAFGPDLNSLEMTEPVLIETDGMKAKEVSIAPLNKKGFRYNLIESRDRRPDITYSIIKVAIAKDMCGAWEYGETAFHPAEHNIPWISGHSSPGPLFSKNFIDVGEGKLLGVINGCKPNKNIGNQVIYGDFSIGLYIYDYENGKIDWVSPEPIIQDSEAGKDGGRAITFASQFIETKNGEGILYAHVDDSFVRAYTLKAEEIKRILPIKIIDSKLYDIKYENTE